METTLLVAASSSALTGVAFAYLGWRIRSRPVPDDLAPGNQAHALWWACLGGYLVLQAGLTFVAWAGDLTVGAYLASRVLAIPLLCTAVWGLSSYLAYLWTGSRQALRALAALYLGVAAVFAYATFAGPPALVIDRWVIGLDDSALLYKSVYALVGLPPIVASLLYLRLALRAPDLAQRRRALLTSLSIVAYVGGGLAARLSASDLVVFLSLVPLGLVAAGTALAAQAPPLQQRPASSPAGFDPEFGRRLRELL